MQKPNSLYYICHKDNLISILQNGIYCRAQAPDGHAEINDLEVLSRRKDKEVNGKSLHDYVNLYFCPRNAMLYRLKCNGYIDDVVILSINSSILNREEVFISDRNAASSRANFHIATEGGLREINGEVFKKKYWTDSDDVKQKMMAEVLVPGHISSGNIVSIFTARRDDVSTLRTKLPHTTNISAEPDMFFIPTFRSQITKKIFLSRGDMFFSDMQTFTISVNTKGIMGKGLASRAKYQFPDAYVRYQDDCRSGKLKIGKPTLYKREKHIEEELADDVLQLDQEKLNGSRWFLFLPTKKDWRHDSKIEDIEESLQWLVTNYEREGIESIALPALGCGLGNLQWSDVGPVMCNYLKQININSCVYLPMEQEISKDHLSPDYLLNGGVEGDS